MASSLLGSAPVIPSSILSPPSSSTVSLPSFSSVTDPTQFLIPNVTNPSFYCKTNFASASGAKVRSKKERIRGVG